MNRTALMALALIVSVAGFAGFAYSVLTATTNAHLTINAPPPPANVTSPADATFSAILPGQTSVLAITLTCTNTAGKSLTSVSGGHPPGITLSTQETLPLSLPANGTVTIHVIATAAPDITPTTYDFPIIFTVN